MKNFFSAVWAGLGHGATSFMGIIGIICGSSIALGLIPPPYGAIAMGVCGIVHGIGLVAAADANKVAMVTPAVSASTAAAVKAGP